MCPSYITRSPPAGDLPTFWRTWQRSKACYIPLGVAGSLAALFRLGRQLAPHAECLEVNRIPQLVLPDRSRRITALTEGVIDRVQRSPLVEIGACGT